MGKEPQIPSIEELERELARERRKKRRSGRLVNFLCVVATVIAVAVLAAALWVPMVQIYGDAMEPNLHQDDVLVSAATGAYAPGDIIAFYHNNTIQVRRIIAGPGSRIELNQSGLVIVNDEPVFEPYLERTALGQCDLEMPYIVPDGCYFVMGDNRENSIDSRSSVMGCVSADRIIGKIVFRLWPLNGFGLIGDDK